MNGLPKTAKPTPVKSYSIEYTVTSNKVVYATDDNDKPQKFESAPSLSEDEVGDLCVETVLKAIRAFKAVQPTFNLMITPSGKIYLDPSFKP